MTRVVSDIRPRDTVVPLRAGQDVRETAARLTTRHGLVGALRDLGVRPGDVLLVHSVLRHLGHVEEGAYGLFDALLEAVGRAGTLVFLASTEENSDTSWAFRSATAGLGPSEVAAYKARMPAFDPLWTPASPGVGALTEVVRKLPGAVRSSHPQSSFVAVGLLAEGIVRHHNPASHFGEQSPLARLNSLPDAKVLMLGGDFSMFSAFHLAEYRQPVPATRWYRCVIPDGLGRPMWFSYEDVVLDLRDFGRIGAEMVEQVPVGTGRLGNAGTLLVPLTAAVDFGTEWMARNRVDGTAAVA